MLLALLLVLQPAFLSALKASALNPSLGRLSIRSLSLLLPNLSLLLQLLMAVVAAVAVNDDAPLRKMRQ